MHCYNPQTFINVYLRLIGLSDQEDAFKGVSLRELNACKNDQDEILQGLSKRGKIAMKHALEKFDEVTNGNLSPVTRDWLARVLQDTNEVLYSDIMAANYLLVKEAVFTDFNPQDIPFVNVFTSWREKFLQNAKTRPNTYMDVNLKLVFQNTNMTVFEAAVLLTLLKSVWPKDVLPGFWEQGLTVLLEDHKNLQFGNTSVSVQSYLPVTMEPAFDPYPVRQPTFDSYPARREPAFIPDPTFQPASPEFLRLCQNHWVNIRARIWTFLPAIKGAIREFPNRRTQEILNGCNILSGEDFVNHIVQALLTSNSTEEDIKETYGKICRAGGNTPVPWLTMPVPVTTSYAALQNLWNVWGQNKYLVHAKSKMVIPALQRMRPTPTGLEKAMARAGRAGLSGVEWIETVIDSVLDTDFDASARKQIMILVADQTNNNDLKNAAFLL